MKPDQFALGLVASLNIHSTYQSRLKYSSDGRGCGTYNCNLY